MASLKNSRTFYVLISIVTLLLKIEKNGAKSHYFTAYNLISMKNLFLYLLHLGGKMIHTFAYLNPNRTEPNRTEPFWRTLQFLV
jgi:hypothetical protein